MRSPLLWTMRSSCPDTSGSKCSETKCQTRRPFSKHPQNTAIYFWKCSKEDFVVMKSLSLLWFYSFFNKSSIRLLCVAVACQRNNINSYPFEDNINYNTHPFEQPTKIPMHAWFSKNHARGFQWNRKGLRWRGRHQAAEWRAAITQGANRDTWRGRSKAASATRDGRSTFFWRGGRRRECVAVTWSCRLTD